MSIKNQKPRKLFPIIAIVFVVMAAGGIAWNIAHRKTAPVIEAVSQSEPLSSAIFTTTVPTSTETTVEETTTEATTKSAEATTKKKESVSKSEWLSAYKDYLMKICESREQELDGIEQYGNNGETVWQWYYFDLCYVDDDDVPELVFSEGNIHSSNTKILTYKDGGIRPGEKAGQFGQVWIKEKSGEYVALSSGQGYDLVDVYRLDDGVFGHIWSGYGPNEYNMDSDQYYSVFSSKVTKEEYLKQYKQHVPDWFNKNADQYVYYPDNMFDLTEDGVAEWYAEWK